MLAALPLEAINKMTNSKQELYKKVQGLELTADGSAIEEGLHDIHIHIDRQLLLLDNALIPLDDSLLDPT